MEFMLEISIVNVNNLAENCNNYKIKITIKKYVPRHFSIFFAYFKVNNVVKIFFESLNKFKIAIFKVEIYNSVEKELVKKNCEVFRYFATPAI